jgi:hypothetical protein
VAERDYEFAVGPLDGPMTTYRRECADQCPAKDDLGRERCQGVLGHGGQHWYYKPNGFLVRWKRDEDVAGPHDPCHSITPPGHMDYVHPKDKLKDWHTSHDRVFEVEGPPTPWDEL